MAAAPRARSRQSGGSPYRARRCARVAACGPCLRRRARRGARRGSAARACEPSKRSPRSLPGSRCGRADSVLPAPSRCRACARAPVRTCTDSRRETPGVHSSIREAGTEPPTAAGGDAGHWSVKQQGASRWAPCSIACSLRPVRMHARMVPFLLVLLGRPLSCSFGKRSSKICTK